MKIAKIILLALVVFPALLTAQENWGPPQFQDDSLYLVCWGYGMLYPAISNNDSLLFYVGFCFDGFLTLAYSLYWNGTWSCPIPAPGSINILDPKSPFYQEFPDSTLYFATGDLWSSRFNGNDLLEPARLDSIINTPADEQSPSEPLDRSRLYFLRDGVIMYSNIVGDMFETPVQLPDNVNSSLMESDPRISPDGQRLYFNRQIDGMHPSYMMVSNYSNGSWQEPVQLNSNINFSAPDPDCEIVASASYAPTFSLNGTKMYFSHIEAVSYYCEPGLGIFWSQLVTGAEDSFPILPSKFTISAYPNPFNTNVSIQIAGEIANLSEIAIYDILGKKIRDMPTQSSLNWDATDNGNKPVSSGIYFAVAQAGGRNIAQKITLLR